MLDLLDSPKYVNAVCLQLLLQELVPMSVRVTQQLEDTYASDHNNEPVSDTKIDTPLSSIEGDTPGHVAVFNSQHLTGDQCTMRIEQVGFDLGHKLTEVLMYQTPNQSRMSDILEIMKFICRDAWKCLHGKQMDNLRTNHRGTFVLIDANYSLTSGLDSAAGIQDTLAKARSYAYVPSGIIRGILLSFGVEAYVAADFLQFPSITFNIQTSINN